MMIFKKSIPRRTFLRGTGAALALPLLDAMFPAFASAASNGLQNGHTSFILHGPKGIIMDNGPRRRWVAMN